MESWYSVSRPVFLSFGLQRLRSRSRGPWSQVKMNVCSIWPFAQISDDFYNLDIWRCAFYFVTALFKELVLIAIIEMWIVGLELLGLGFYDKVSVSSRNLSSVSTTSLMLSQKVCVESDVLAWRPAPFCKENNAVIEKVHQKELFG